MKRIEAENINGYLMDGADVWIESRTKPLCDVPKMMRGNQPTDGGNLILDEGEMSDLVEREPMAKQYVRRFMMGYGGIWVRM